MAKRRMLLLLGMTHKPLGYKCSRCKWELHVPNMTAAERYPAVKQKRQFERHVCSDFSTKKASREDVSQASGADRAGVN